MYQPHRCWCRRAARHGIETDTMSPLTASLRFHILPTIVPRFSRRWWTGKTLRTAQHQSIAPMRHTTTLHLASALTGVLLLDSTAAAGTLLPSIPKGTISINLVPVAIGLAAPDYAISAPGDPGRLFVLEQKGQVLVIQNGSLLPTPALNIQSLVSPPLVITNANDERGLLGLAFHPGFNDLGSPGYRTLYTYNSQLIPSGGSPTYAAPNNATQGYENAINEWKLSSSDLSTIDPASRAK